MNQNIKELIEVSRSYGKDKAYVIAGGGNTSFKDEKHIWIKASGTSLETIDEHGFVCLSRAKLKAVSTKQYSQDATAREAEVKADLAAAIVSVGNNRPSVETSMHEIINYQFVVHTHPTRGNALMCSVSAESTCRELFGDQALFIPYTDPGYILFKKVETEISKFTTAFGVAPKLIFLENHGVFVAADTVSEIDALYTDLMGKINSRITSDLPLSKPEAFSSPIIDRIQEIHPGFATYTAKGITDSLILGFAKDLSAFKKATTAFTPDDIVYCKAHYLFVPSVNDPQKQIEITGQLVDDYLKSYSYLPKVLVLEGKGVIAVEDSMKSVLNVLEVYSNILKISFLSENFGGPKFMTKAQIDFIDNWEVENYRRQMAKS